jgi:hypothetical protein
MPILNHPLSEEQQERFKIFEKVRDKWVAEAKEKGSNFYLDNWRTFLTREYYKVELRLFLQGKSNIDMVKLKFDAYAVACRQKSVRVGDKTIVTVTPQVQPSNEDLHRMCTLLGIRDEDYIRRYL